MLPLGLPLVSSLITGLEVPLSPWSGGTGGLQPCCPPKAIFWRGIWAAHRYCFLRLISLFFCLCLVPRSQVRPRNLVTVLRGVFPLPPESHRTMEGIPFCLHRRGLREVKGHPLRGKRICTRQPKIPRAPLQVCLKSAILTTNF